MGKNSKRMVQQYDSEFRAKAIQLAVSSSQPIAATAKQLGIKEATLYQWVSDHKKAFIKHNPKNGTDVYAELTQLRKENARLKEERAILKKAAIYFAQQSQ